MKADTAHRRGLRRASFYWMLAAWLGAASAVTACGNSAAPADQVPTITPTVTAIAPSPTPIVITMSASPTAVPIPPPTATMPPTPTELPAATRAPQPLPLPSPTAKPTIELGAFVGTDVALPAVPVSATTGITATGLLSLTEVPPPVAPVKLPPGVINIALLGVDTRPVEKGMLTDVIIIASINPNIPAVTLLSIPRDTLVYIPNRRMAKVNTAFAAGPDVFKQTIKYNFGLNVDYYATINFAGLVNAVNTLGGIEVIATCPLYQVFPKDPYYSADPVTPLTVTAPYTDAFTGEVWQPGQAVPTQTINIPRPGVYKLNGLQALAYARARYGVPGGDVDRTRRAQRVLRALLHKVRSSSLIAITRLPALLNQFARNVKTDLTLDQILSLAAQADRFDDSIIRSRYFDDVGMTSVTLPVVGAVLIPNRDNITPYLQMALNVPLNQQAGSGIAVEVWNGTHQADFGIVAADRLRELGFNVVSIQDADGIYSKTQVIDFTTTAKGSAIPLLQRALGLRPENVIAQPNPDGPRYRIIAGRDFDPCYYKTTPPNVRAAPSPIQPTNGQNTLPTGDAPAPPTEDAPADPNAPPAEPTPTPAPEGG
ncbi:LCP family protein [Candidatus Roseilinea sp. NK_OTU-006]|jgi:anionic cell wall polymer biosynthesis LytR-Cps2A-Psr (LCP) family protein|uniref:LCP family protein n=1 Tax=Candidatus Roseilinea sp. NK_OTU-006 TaxID=2704250 RepID=UPI00145D2D2C|nr:LCP family protein [Candidatus Roseilinea sp. NK_OTU-006]